MRAHFVTVCIKSVVDVLELKYVSVSEKKIVPGYFTDMLNISCDMTAISTSNSGLLASLICCVCRGFVYH